MDIRARILAAIHGEPNSPVPWTSYAGLVPTSLKERLLRERGLGLQRQVSVCHTERPHVEEEYLVTERGGARTIQVTYRTPVGQVSMLQKARSGTAYGTAWTVKPFITSLADYEVMRYYIDDAVYSPNYDGIITADNRLGSDGIVLGAVGLSPFQTLVNPDWLGMDGVSYWMADHPKELDELNAALSRRYAEIYQIAEGAPVELIHSDENVTALMVGPSLYRRYLAPFYDLVVPGLHAAGKLYVCHYDGSIMPLRDELARSPIDVVEAFTPPPMGDISVSQAKAAWPNKAIWSNFPGSIFLQDYQGVRDFTLELLRDAAPGGRFVLGITEDVPLDLWEKGLTAMADALDEYHGG